MAKMLTVAAVEKLKPAKARREVPAGGVTGFYLVIQPSGSKSWAFRYRNTDGKPRKVTMGQWPAMELDDARAHALELWRRAKKGEDLVATAKAEREAEAQITAAEEAAAAAAVTYEAAVEDYVRRYQIGTKGNARAAEVKRVLLKEGSDWIDKPVRSITAKDIRALLEAIRDGDDDPQDGDDKQAPRPYLANRTYSYLRTFFGWCAEPGIELVDDNPMVGLKAPWDGESVRDRVFTDDELKALWRAGGALWGPDEPIPAADATVRYQGAFLRCLLILGKRKNTLAAMRHDEIDEDGVWRPPQPARRRARNKRDHAVPVPVVVRQIIASLPRRDGNPFVFVGRRTGGHIDPGTPLQQQIQEMSGVADFFYHATRHTIETRLAEFEVPPHIRDLLLDHAPARGSGAGYDHHSYVKEMRDALTRWADHITGLIPSPACNVVAMRPA